MDESRSASEYNDRSHSDKFIQLKHKTTEPNKQALGVLSLSHIVSDMYGGFVLPIMPLIAVKLNISLALVGVLHSVASLSSSISQPFFGYLADLVNKRFFVFWGLILSSVFISLTGHVNNLWTLSLVLLLGNLGVGFFHPQATAFAGHFSGRQINKFIGIFMACGTVGFALGPLFSSFLADNFGLKSTIWAIFPGFIAAFLIYFLLPKVPLKVKYTNPASAFAKIVEFKHILLPLIFISILRALSVVSFEVFMPFIWEKLGFSIMTIGILVALFSFFGGFSSIMGGTLADKLGEKLILTLCLLLSTPFLLGTLYFVNKNFPLSCLLFMIAGFIVMLSVSVNITIAHKAIPENTGMVSGIIGGFCWGIAGLLLTPIGALADAFGIEKVLYVIALTPLLGVISVYFIPDRASD